VPYVRAVPKPSIPADLPAADPTVTWRTGPPLPEDRPRTLTELFARCLAAFPDAVVLDDGGRHATWRDLDAWSGRLAWRLRDRLGPGDRFAIIAHNGLPHLLAELAAWRLGAVAVPVFTGFGAARIAGLLTQVEPRLALVGEPALATAVPVKVERLSPEQLLAWAEEPGSVGDRPVTPDSVCLIQFTSGSTGTPRGVMLGHDNLCSQQAAYAGQWPEVGPGDRLASYLPWHHSFGGLAERLWALCRGARMTLVPGGGRDHLRLIATVRAVRPTVFLSVPKMHALLTEAEAFDLTALRWVFTAGAPLTEALDRWYARRGIPVFEGWGLTETSPTCTLTPPGAQRLSGVVGQPIPGVSVGVRAADGRLLVRGPNVMRGYFRQESSCLVAGTFDTGDLGEWTDAGLRLTGRADHQLKLANGEKVAAAAIEAQLLAQPGVIHAVITVEEGVVALIEVGPGQSPAAARAAVDAVNAEQPIPYLRIAEAYLVREPMTVENSQLTASHKVARRQVLDRFLAWRNGGGSAFIRL
jgi:long-subunit acyl-CoA synthetase (AMP-forming)